MRSMLATPPVIPAPPELGLDLTPGLAPPRGPSPGSHRRLVDAGPHPNAAHAAWGRRLQRLDPDPVTADTVRCPRK